MELLKQNNGTMKAAYCIGCGGEVLIAAAMAPPLGVNELEIANAMKPIEVMKAKLFDAILPADSRVEPTLHHHASGDGGRRADL